MRYRSVRYSGVQSALTVPHTLEKGYNPLLPVPPIPLLLPSALCPLPSDFSPLIPHSIQENLIGLVYSVNSAVYGT
jgi:hypothetical protein